MQLDPVTGAIVHLVDKATGVDLVNAASGYRMNEYLYHGRQSRLLHSGQCEGQPPARGRRHPARARAHGPPRNADGAARGAAISVGTVVTMRATATNTRALVSTITLFDAIRRVEIANEVDKVATLRKEGVSFAFPFALAQPQVRYQGATAWVNPVTDMLPGANRQWFTTQGGVWAKGAGGAAAWATSDAPLVTLGDINRGLWPASLDLRNATLFSYMMNNYWYTDTPARQGGVFTFRYALTSGPDVSLADAIALSADQRSPLVAIRRYSMGWEPQIDAAGESLSTCRRPAPAC